MKSSRKIWLETLNKLGKQINSSIRMFGNTAMIFRIEGSRQFWFSKHPPCRTQHGVDKSGKYSERWIFIWKLSEVIYHNDL